MSLLFSRIGKIALAVVIVVALRAITMIAGFPIRIPYFDSFVMQCINTFFRFASSLVGITPIYIQGF
jgi:hypothetical protein